MMAVTALLTIGLTSGVSSQARTDFSGTWVLGNTPGASSGAIEGRGNSQAGQLRVGPGVGKLVISQRGDKLRIEEYPATISTTPRNTVEYWLSGQPVTNLFFNIPVIAPSLVTSTWQEDKVVSAIDVFVPGEDAPRRYTETLSISSEGILAVRIQRVGSPDSRTMFYKRDKEDSRRAPETRTRRSPLPPQSFVASGVLRER
jgi:hypothetical protein